MLHLGTKRCWEKQGSFSPVSDVSVDFEGSLGTDEVVLFGLEIFVMSHGIKTSLELYAGGALGEALRAGFSRKEFREPVYVNWYEAGRL